MNFGSEIIGTGSAFPERAMTNQEFEKFVETNDEWIQSRTGIKTRYIADLKKGENTLSLSHAAVKKALESAGVSGEEIDMIVVGTVTPDSMMPTTANRLQALIGAKNAFTLDLQAACSGFLFALSMADQHIRTGTIRTALVVGAETLSNIVDWSDRSTCVLFGDGAGAAVVRATEGENRVLKIKLRTDGSYGELLKIPHGGSACPPWSPDYRNDMSKIKMKGSEVFKLAVRNMLEVSEDVLKSCKMTSNDVDFFIFHQANLRIIEMCAKTLGVPAEKMWNNVSKYGNTSAATLPVCLDEARRAGAIKKGDVVLMATFGGGLTWAGGLMRN